MTHYCLVIKEMIMHNAINVYKLEEYKMKYQKNIKLGYMSTTTLVKFYNYS